MIILKMKNKSGPTTIVVCHGCDYYEAWYGHCDLHARCKKKVWIGVKSRPRGTSFITPKNCKLKEVK